MRKIVLSPNVLANKLSDGKYDEETHASIQYRCSPKCFPFPKEEIQKLAQNGEGQAAAVEAGRSAFDRHVGHEKKIIETYKDEMEDERARLNPMLQKERDDLVRLTREGKDRVADRIVVNIPQHSKLQQAVVNWFAWILVSAGIIQLAIFLHNQNGMEWWQAFVVPFSGVVGLSWAVKYGLTSLYQDHRPVYKAMKYLALLVGIGSLATWVVMYSQYAVTLAQGPRFESLDGTTAADTGGHGSQIMVALQILGEAFVAGFLFTIVSEITAKHTYSNGVDHAEEYKHDMKEVANIEKDLKFVNSRIAHTKGLLSQLAEARVNVEDQSRAMYGKLMQSRK